MHEIRVIAAVVGIMTIIAMLAGLLLAISEWDRLPDWMRYGTAPLMLMLALLAIAGWGIYQWFRALGLLQAG